MRRRVGGEGYGFPGQILNAVDALPPDQAVSAARPVDHVKSARPKALVLELSIVLGPDVCRGQHHVDIAGSQSCGPFRPVIDDLERDLETFSVVDRTGLGIKPAVGYQACRASYPDVDADAHFVRLGRARSR